MMSTAETTKPKMRLTSPIVALFDCNSTKSPARGRSPGEGRFQDWPENGDEMPREPLKMPEFGFECEECDGWSYEQVMCERLEKYLHDLRGLRADARKLKLGPVLNIPQLLLKHRLVSPPARNHRSPKPRRLLRADPRTLRCRTDGFGLSSSLKYGLTPRDQGKRQISVKTMLPRLRSPPRSPGSGILSAVARGCLTPEPELRAIARPVVIGRFTGGEKSVIRPVRVSNLLLQRPRVQAGVRPRPLQSPRREREGKFS